VLTVGQERRLSSMTIPAKSMTKCDKPSSTFMFTLSSHEKRLCRENYTVPVKSAANVITQACQRVRPMDLCEAVGLDPKQLNAPDDRIPLRKLVALFEEGAKLTREPAFGLRVGAKTEFRTFDLLGYIVMNSATLEEALSSAVRYFPLWTDGAGFRTQRDGSAVHFAWEYADPEIGECRQDSEMTLLAASKIGSLLAGDVRPREVHFQHSAPKDASEHRRLFGAPVFFCMPANQLIFNRAALASRVKGADQGLCALLVRYADDLLRQAAHHRLLTDRTQVALRRCLRHGDRRVATVAHEMGMSVRTLQRGLRAKGYSYGNLLAKVRRELAEQHLQDSEMAVSEVAYHLGYTQPSEFHRAFRAWTGTTPRQYRRSALP